MGTDHACVRVCLCVCVCVSQQAVDVWSVGCIFAEVLLGKPLFPGRDAVSQLQLITDLLGKPSQHTIDRIGNPKARAFLNALPPKQPRPLEQKFPNADPQALAILRRLLCFDASERPSAADALTDPYFSTLPGGARQDAAAYDRQQFDFELRKMSEEEVRALIYEEVSVYVRSEKEMSCHMPAHMRTHVSWSHAKAPCYHHAHTPVPTQPHACTLLPYAWSDRTFLHASDSCMCGRVCCHVLCLYRRSRTIPQWPPRTSRCRARHRPSHRPSAHQA